MSTISGRSVGLFNGVRRNMQIEKWRVIRDVLASFLIFAVIVNTGKGISVGIVSIGLINSVEVAEVVQAYQKYRQQQRREYLDEKYDE